MFRPCASLSSPSFCPRSCPLPPAQPRRRRSASPSGRKVPPARFLGTSRFPVRVAVPSVPFPSSHVADEALASRFAGHLGFGFGCLSSKGCARPRAGFTKPAGSVESASPCPRTLRGHASAAPALGRSSDALWAFWMGLLRYLLLSSDGRVLPVAASPPGRVARGAPPAPVRAALSAWRGTTRRHRLS